MALNSTQNWWIRFGAGVSELNGGGFDYQASGVTYNSVSQSLTLSARDGDAVTATAGGGSTFASGDVGKIIKNTTSGGTGWAQITAYTSTTVVTVRVLDPFNALVVTSTNWSLSDQINYADQDSPQLSLTDLATTGVVTTLTSVTGGFTNAMIGNIIRIASGTNFTAGYYRIVSYTNTNTVALDRAPATGAGVSGVGRLGGAHASLVNMSSRATTGALATPLIGLNRIHIRGAGSNYPSSNDYTWTSGEQYTLDGFGGAPVQVIGYNGRPRFELTGPMGGDDWIARNLYLFASTASPSNLYRGLLTDYGAYCSSVYNCYFDANGQDIAGAGGFHFVENCEFGNSGSTSSGTLYAIDNAVYAVPQSGRFHGNTIKGWRGGGIRLIEWHHASNNTISSCHGTGCAGIEISSNGLQVQRNISVFGNDVYGCAGHGIYASNAYPGIGYIASVNALLRNNVIVSNGGYGIYFNGGSVDASYAHDDYNAFYNNTSGESSGVNRGTHNVTLTGDPFTNAAGGDFSLNNTAGAGAAARAVGTPGVFPGGLTTSYLDIGAVQHLLSVILAIGAKIIFRNRNYV